MRFKLLRGAVFVLIASLPLWWVYQAWLFALGPDPGKVLVDRLGLGTLILLMVSLGMTPMQRLTGWPFWIIVRRQLGLWCFAYVVLHLAAYLFFILGLDWQQLGEELRRRPYIIVGTVGFVGLLMLAATSNRYSQKRLGARWRKLHKLSYVVLGLGLLHFLWIVRADLKEWTAYGLVATVLLLLRLPAIARRIPRLITKKPLSATKG